MAKNTDNKRLAVKHVRDKAKAAYEKKSNCYICDTTQDLELHHTHSITLLLNKWAAEKSYDISTDEGILAVRDEFIEEHTREIYEAVFTLCNRDHIKLHQVYGKAPLLSSASKQERWIELQRAKYTSGETTPAKEIIKETSGAFSRFY